MPPVRLIPPAISNAAAIAGYVTETDAVRCLTLVFIGVDGSTQELEVFYAPDDWAVTASLVRALARQLRHDAHAHPLAAVRRAAANYPKGD